jgi:hypothetical protein
MADVITPRGLVEVGGVVPASPTAGSLSVQ